MKKLTITLALLTALSIQSKLVTQQADTVSTAQNYVNRVYYSLDNNIVHSENNQTWDIALSCHGLGAAGAAILINEASSFVYNTPYDTGVWNTFDTTGSYTWKQLLNSDTTWTNGAFNTYRGAAGLYDMGWGILNPNNNHLTFGDSIYLVKLHDGSFRKLVITSLKTGVWEINYANLNGSNPQQLTVTKANYPKRNFVYLSLVNNQVYDLEPDNDTWELLFIKHREFINNMYVSVAGILNNKNVWSAKAHLPDYATAMNTETAQTTFTKNISNIGFEWKKFSSQTGWKVYDTIAYFVYNYDSTMFYRIVFTEFGGMANGNYIFNKTLLKNLSVASFRHNLKTLSVYPNPSNGYFSILADVRQANEYEVLFHNLQGQMVYSNKISLAAGVHHLPVSASHLSSGMYLLTLRSEEVNQTVRFVIE